MRLGQAGGKGAESDFDRLELELRKLPEVVAVGFDGISSPDSLVLVHLLVSDASSRSTVEEHALDLGRLHLDRPLRVVVAPEGGEGLSSTAFADGAFGAVYMPSRVQLVGVTFVDDATTVEVTLGHGEQRSAGRGAAGSPTGAATAALVALRQLGWAVPFQLASAVRLAVGTSGAVLVHLIGPDGERLGISVGETAELAAAKATLQALNRWLDDPSRRPVTAKPG
jgi:hypothetical protein